MLIIPGGHLPRAVTFSSLVSNPGLKDRLLNDTRIKNLGWNEKSLGGLIENLTGVLKNIGNVFEGKRRFTAIFLREEKIEEPFIIDYEKRVVIVPLYQRPQQLAEVHRQVAFSVSRMIFAGIPELSGVMRPLLESRSAIYEISFLLEGVGIRAKPESIAEKIVNAVRVPLFDVLVYSLANRMLARDKCAIEKLRADAARFFEETKEFLRKVEVAEDEGGRMFEIVAELAFYLTAEDKFGDPKVADQYVERFSGEIVKGLAEMQSFGAMLASESGASFVPQPYINACRNSFFIMLDNLRWAFSSLYDHFEISVAHDIPVGPAVPRDKN